MKKEEYRWCGYCLYPKHKADGWCMRKIAYRLFYAMLLVALAAHLVGGICEHLDKSKGEPWDSQEKK